MKFLKRLFGFNSAALKQAIEHGELDNVNALIAAGVDVNERTYIGGKTALMSAAGKGHADCVNTLIAAGADVNAVASCGTLSGLTALMFAAASGHENCVNALIAGGAKVNTKTSDYDICTSLNFDNCTALEFADRNRHLNCMAILRAAGATISTEHLGAPPPTWPRYSSQLKVLWKNQVRYVNELAAFREIKVYNNNDFKVRVGLRTGDEGFDFIVPPMRTRSPNVPSRRNYDVYFNYSSDPDGLYQGDSFTLQNSITISIVKVMDGNYRIRNVN